MTLSDDLRALERVGRPMLWLSSGFRWKAQLELNSEVPGFEAAVRCPCSDHQSPEAAVQELLEQTRKVFASARRTSENLPALDG